MCAECSKVSQYDAVGILDGFVEPESAADVVRACLHIKHKGPRGILCGSGTVHALEIADYADAHGIDAAVDRMQEG